MHLARLEARVALDAVLDRLPGIRLDPSRPAAVRGLVFRKPGAVPVRVGVSEGARAAVGARSGDGPPRHAIERAYGSAMNFPAARPYLVANFVQTIDGVVAFGARGGDNAGTVSMDSEIDRRVMALLRAHADSILIGAGTFRTARSHQWSPGGLVPDEADAFDALRAADARPRLRASAALRRDGMRATSTPRTWRSRRPRRASRSSRRPRAPRSSRDRCRRTSSCSCSPERRDRSRRAGRRGRGPQRRTDPVRGRPAPARRARPGEPRRRAVPHRRAAGCGTRRAAAAHGDRRGLRGDPRAGAEAAAPLAPARRGSPLPAVRPGRTPG